MLLNFDSESKKALASPEVTTFFCYELFYDKADPSVSLKWTNWSENVVLTIDGKNKTFTPNAIKHNEITESSDGKINDLSLTVGNADRVIQTYADRYDLIMAKVKIYQIFEGVNGLMAMDFYVKSITAKTDVAAIVLSNGIDVLKLTVPGRRMFSRFCWWNFKDSDCKYTGPDSDCNRTFDDCKAKKNTKRFGGFPSIMNERFYF